MPPKRNTPAAGGGGEASNRAAAVMAAKKKERQQKKLHEQHAQEYLDGSRYSGPLRKGKPHGQGTVTFANGESYTGQWKEGKYHGQGTFTYATRGSVYNGLWEGGKKHGQGTYTYPDGAVFKGEYQEGEQHGEGKLFDAQGNTLQEGKWVQGVFIVLPDEGVSLDHPTDSDSSTLTTAAPTASPTPTKSSPEPEPLDATLESMPPTAGGGVGGERGGEPQARAAPTAEGSSFAVISVHPDFTPRPISGPHHSQAPAAPVAGGGGGGHDRRPVNASGYSVLTATAAGLLCQGPPATRLLQVDSWWVLDPVHRYIHRYIHRKSDASATCLRILFQDLLVVHEWTDTTVSPRPFAVAPSVEREENPADAAAVSTRNVLEEVD